MLPYIELADALPSHESHEFTFYFVPTLAKFRFTIQTMFWPEIRLNTSSTLKFLPILPIHEIAEKLPTMEDPDSNPRH